ncbi:unnamed protein product [Anisakis simplex]|uniref:G_PROTEIN_RECEP_F1_2 domain-containing protein n=1 Tax=Anisakis simplex TaxID=6269 RepID=A0A0M3JRS3_ANISI|nr:unnamed protein product [Anisakis simplex]
MQEGRPVVSDEFLSSSSLNLTTPIVPVSYFTSTSSSPTTSISSSNNEDVLNQIESSLTTTDYDELPDWCNVLSSDCECHILYQFYDYEEVLMLGLITLPIIIFGLCANLTSVRIFTHRLMINSSINWYLGVLSCSDTFILFSAFFVLSLPRIGEYTGFWAATSCR